MFTHKMHKSKCKSWDVLQSICLQKHLEQQMFLSLCCFFSHNISLFNLFCFVFMMQWRLLYILTLSERVLHSCSDLCSLGGAPAVRGWSKDKVTGRWLAWKQQHLGKKWAPFFLSMLQDVQYLEMILFTDSLYSIFVSFVCLEIVFSSDHKHRHVPV